MTNCQPLTDCSFPQATGWTYTESPRVFDLPDSRRTGHGPCHCLDLNRGREEAFRGDNGVDNDVHTHRQTKRKSDIKKKTNMNMRCKSSQCQWHVKENDGILHCCGPWWRRIQMLKRCLFRSSSVAHFLCPNIMSISRYCCDATKHNQRAKGKLHKLWMICCFHWALSGVYQVHTILFQWITG